MKNLPVTQDNLEGLFNTANQVCTNQLGLQQSTFEKILKFVEQGLKLADIIGELAKLSKISLFSGKPTMSTTKTIPNPTLNKVAPK